MGQVIDLIVTANSFPSQQTFPKKAKNVIELIIPAWFAIQILSGYTLGSDHFKGFGGGTPIPRGRWPCLIHRSEDPAYYWTILAGQAA